MMRMRAGFFFSVETQPTEVVFFIIMGASAAG